MLLKCVISVGLLAALVMECHSAVIRSHRVARAIPTAPLLVGYWGQNGAGPTFGQANYERSLEWYCENSKYDIINVAFLINIFDPSNQDNLPGLNFAFHCGGGVTPQHPNLLRCPNIENGINKCHEHNKKVLISVGGSTMFANLGSVENGVQHAQHLWDLFLGGNVESNLRPFGRAVMDGVDFNLEAGNFNFFPDTVRELRRLMATDSSKQYLITSAPQCPIPDHLLGPITPGTLLADTGNLTDYVFVQYYNNFCWTGAGADFTNNLASWLAFGVAANVGVMIGLPGHTGASGQARYHRTVADVDAMWQSVKDMNGIGGIMLWDASWDQNNVIDGRMYSEHINDILDGSASSTAAPSTTQPPTSTPAPVTTQPPTSTPAPVTTQPPTTTPAPVTTQPPTTTPAPVTTQPPTTTPAPVTTQPPTTTPAPVTTQPPTSSEEPTTTQAPTTTAAPTTTQTPEPPTTQSLDNFCVGRQGIYHAHPTDCSKFIMCVHGTTYIQSCPSGLVFDPSINVCNWPYLVNCQSSA